MSGTKQDFFSINPRRRTKNFVLQPLLQLKLPAYLLLLTFAFAFLFSVHSYVNFERLYTIMLQHTDQPAYFERVIEAQTANFKIVSASMSVAYVMLMLAITVMYTHRLVGPTVAFRRHIENIKNGDYASRIALRRSDAFNEVATELNELAQMLEASEKGPGSSDA